MQNENGSPLLYEQVLSVSFVLFLKSLQLYAELGNQATSDPTIFRNAKIQTGLENIMTTIETCGRGLERLPAPPPGAELVDRQLRDLGREICEFSDALKQLTRVTKREQRKYSAIDFQKCAAKLKGSFREAVEGFERIYPGRLKQVIESQKLTYLH